MSEEQINLKPIRRKKVVFQTDSTLAKTGFGKAARNYIEYLYRLNKFDIVHIAVGMTNANPAELERYPWKTIASINIQQLQALKQNNDPRNHEGLDRMAGYGAFTVEDAIKQEKPDVFIGCQDIWGVDFSTDKTWWNKITSALWVTLDSLPILPRAVELAPKVKNYWSWADFATKSLHDLGHKHVKTVRGPLDTDKFRRLSNDTRKKLREDNKLDEKDFIIGFVFRNQLRKSVPNLLQGFNFFKKENPSTKTKLLLHTCWSEGWDIPKLMTEHGIKSEDVLTTYVCRSCKKYRIQSFKGQEQDCPHCQAKGQLVTTHPTIGVNEEELNEIYNLMDVYCHPFTSGGQEIPIQEAKLTELVTLVTNYSCGEDSCNPEAASLSLDWDEYREPGTQFIKATTKPSSIAKQLTKVLNMSDSTRREFGKKARKWVIDNFSTEVIGKFLEDFIDKAPFVDDFNFDKEEAKNPTYNIPSIADNGEWVKHIYHHILNMKDVVDSNDGYQHWMQKLNQGMSRQEIEQFFRKTAWEANQKNSATQTTFDSFLSKEDKGRVLFVVKESAGDILLCTSLFKSIKKRYPEWSLYVATKPEYRDIIIGNPHVHKWLEWNPMMENLIWAEGNSSHNGFFDICYLPTIGTQDKLDYLHQGVDKIDFNILEN
jgi:glycosyltransferase involved in cell wall biosynthesis